MRAKCMKTATWRLGQRPNTFKPKPNGAIALDHVAAGLKTYTPLQVHGAVPHIGGWRR